MDVSTSRTSIELLDMQIMMVESHLVILSWMEVILNKIDLVLSSCEISQNTSKLLKSPSFGTVYNYAC